MKQQSVTNILRPVVIMLGLILFISTFALGQNPQPKCYVVVGAFKFYKNAESFKQKVQGDGLAAQYKLNTYRNLYYVYTYESGDREATKQELFSVRKAHPNLYKAWLYAGDFNGPHIPASEWDNIAESSDEITMEEEEPPEEVVEERVEEEEPEPIVEEEAELSWKVYLNTVNTTTFEEVKGKFLVYDAERNQQIRDIPTNELVKIEDPGNRTNRIRVVSDIFGYHEIEHTFDMDVPEEKNTGNIVETLGDTIVLNLKLQRLRQGDVSTLWKVYFYKDAAIMREESIYELNQLFDMMKANENIKIKIHGHTNGNSHGEVKHLDLDDKEFFSLNGSHASTTASAKKLSLYRAHTIKQWLMAQGIDENRMETKGWGGKKMIYDKFDSQADKNVRVEIEITAE